MNFFIAILLCLAGLIWFAASQAPYRRGATAAAARDTKAGRRRELSGLADGD